jgi:serine/threonine protein kinase
MDTYYIKWRNNNRDIYFMSAGKNSKLIGIGNSGCVFRPSILSGDKAVVTKIYSSDNFNQDLLLDNKIDEIDKLGKYHAKLIHFSQLNLKSLKPAELKQFKQCRLSSQNLDDTETNTFYIVEYEYVGESIQHLSERVLPKNTSKQIYLCYYNVIDGLYFFYEHGISHNDVHLGNIIFDGKTTKLIDFSSNNTTCNAKTCITDLTNALKAFLEIFKDREDLIEDKLDMIQSLIDKGMELQKIPVMELSSNNVYKFYRKIRKTLWYRL